VADVNEADAAERALKSLDAFAAEHLKIGREMRGRLAMPVVRCEGESRLRAA